MMNSLNTRTSRNRIQFSGAREQTSHDRPQHAVGSHLLSVIQAKANNRVSLYPVLANGHRLKRTSSNPLCLPEVLFSKYALLVDLHVPTSCRARI